MATPPAQIDTVVGIASMTEDLLVLLEQLVDPIPVEGDEAPEQRWRTLDRLGVVPRGVLHDAVADPQRVVRGLSLLGAPRVLLTGLEQLRSHILAGEVVDRLMPGFMEQHRTPAVRDDLPGHQRTNPFRA